MRKTLLAAAIAATTTAAHSGVTTCAGQVSTCFPEEDLGALEQIHFDGQASGVYTATGIPQGSGNGNYTIEFTSPEEFNHASGFAQIVAADGSLNQLDFFINPSDTWGLEMFEFSVNPRGPGADIYFSWWTSDGTYHPPTTIYNLGGGEQWFSVLADPETLQGFRMQSVVGFEVASFKHLRTDPDLLNPTEVAAPGNIALLAAGLAGLVVSRRRAR